MRKTGGGRDREGIREGVRQPEKMQGEGGREGGRNGGRAGKGAEWRGVGQINGETERK